MAESSDVLKQAIAASLNLLSYREHCRQELKLKLAQRGFCAEIASSAIEYCITQGWLDEARYTECWIRSRAAKGFGPSRIRSELGAKGIDRALVEEQLNLSECDWFELAVKACHKKLSHQETGSLSREQKLKLTRFLVGRGFSLEQARAAIE
ncbi:regulatory protein RecX [Dongshaea marina]|uniref:regulatory protein RecX n=1 Tax=Dongshaea marina TaxID=2047966 RepID=UPI000D3E79AA|nr:regulatory protein RecX [Dongshaea marina]